ncbi:MAG: hypothetical protein RM368_14320 [Nostoc sp. DedSLP03]|uniref:hypothetical protein n=1 Tax=Nostoc sp. DedSLP03 TaxID=3075400 RepID=UPI002AD47076|nr:hypothetical protein [Nostoc sp. DedSLP03]MDZ7966135.1 hypothetical protein [Nostoc sp. DedSLP03]
MNVDSAIDWDEIFEYLPGTVVELKNNPGVLHQIDYYETTMVPPIWLVNDPIRVRVTLTSCKLSLVVTSRFVISGRRLLHSEQVLPLVFSVN